MFAKIVEKPDYDLIVCETIGQRLQVLLVIKVQVWDPLCQTPYFWSHSSTSAIPCLAGNSCIYIFASILLYIFNYIYIAYLTGTSIYKYKK